MLARRGHFWTGMESVPTETGAAVRGQTYVEYWIPSELRVGAEHLRLGEHGVHGNGHMMMVERNNGEVASVIEAWLSSQGLAD
ncbi:hypothetical protein [Modestobacter sp. URMC 112]